MTLTISVIVPCFNEASTIGSVVRDFRQALPEASVFVYDNNSTDSTVETASAAGAIVRKASLQGKGHVVRRMFADIDSDLYVMVDGDDTYDAGSAEEMIRCLTDEQHDMVIGRRVSTAPAAYRAGHRWGNRVLTALVGWVFGSQFKDMLSGYRVFSRRFVKSFPVMTHGFEIETELAVHALELSMSVAEVDTQYKERPLGSVSKLHTYRDGFRILRIIAFLIKDERPMQFFSIVAVLLGLVSVSLMVPIIAEYMETGLVPRFPTAILSTGVMLSAMLAFFSGLILDTVTHGRREQKRLNYLAIPAVSSMTTKT